MRVANHANDVTIPHDSEDATLLLKPVTEAGQTDHTGSDPDFTGDERTPEEAGYGYGV